MQISVNTFVTLDGVMQGPGGPGEDPRGGFTGGGWIVPFPGEEWGRVVDGWFPRTSAVLLGRHTFEMMRGYWPEVTEQDNRVARVLNQAPKYVVSNTLAAEDAAWGDTTVISGDVLHHVRALKEQGEGELQVHGSWQLVRSLHEAGLVDIFRLLQFPVVLGQGKRLFEEGAAPTGFSVRSAEMVPGGIAALELQQVRLGSHDVGEYAVRDGRESVLR